MFLLFYEQYLEIMVKRGWLFRIVQRTPGIPQRMAPNSKNFKKLYKKAGQCAKIIFWTAQENTRIALILFIVRRGDVPMIKSAVNAACTFRIFSEHLFSPTERSKNFIPAVLPSRWSLLCI
jgi:hypothetical protein